MIDQILEARENRMIEIKQALLNSPMVLLIKANTPGQLKNIWTSKYLVLQFRKLMEHTCDTCESHYFESADGPYVMINLPQDDAVSIKHFLMHIEETHPLGRFIDLDLFDQPNRSISRLDINAEPRTCMLCERPAIECIRNHRHSLIEINQHIEDYTIQYMLTDIKKNLDLAIMTELELEDKFGLVTKTSSGSHPDMNYDLMVTAKHAILDDLVEIFQLGLSSETLDNLFSLARKIGINAEKHMLEATHNINCYKGLITVLGFACLSGGFALKHQMKFSDIFDNIEYLSKDLLLDFHKPLHSFGKKAHELYQITGIRGELSKGLPSIKNVLNNYDHLALEDSITLRKALKDLILMTEDTVFIKRSGSLENYQEIRYKLSALDMDNLIQIKAFTQEMISKHISFGGSADLLVTAIYLQNIKYLFEKKTPLLRRIFVYRASEIVFPCMCNTR